MSEESKLRHEAHRRGVQIAIDGPAGAGKSTVGRALAEALECAYVDTGLMYRALTWLALQRGLSLSDGVALVEAARTISYSLGPCPPFALLINGQPPLDALRGPEVDAAVSQVSAHPEVRRLMVAEQRALGQGRCVVMVGRDIGSVVLPDAPVKLWITASPEERAERRGRELLSGPGVGAGHDLLTQITARDAYDAGRAISPLIQASDAEVIETDRLTPPEALGKALEIVCRAMGRTEGSPAQSGC